MMANYIYFIRVVIKTMGLYNVLTYLYNYTNDNKFIYYEMITNIRSKKTHYPKIKSNISIKFKYMKKIGIKKSLKIMKQNIKEKLRKNKYTHFILKKIRLLLKIICYIPKKIIQFILYI